MTEPEVAVLEQRMDMLPNGYVSQQVRALCAAWRVQEADLVAERARLWDAVIAIDAIEFKYSLENTGELHERLDRIAALVVCLTDTAREQEEEIARLQEGLEESVNLQAHYANLLNMHDGGKRMVFPGVQAWLQRLADVKEMKR